MSHPERTVTRESLSPQNVLDLAIEKLKALDPNTTKVDTVEEAEGIHAIFREVIEHPAMTEFRNQNGERTVLLGSLDSAIIYQTTNGSGSTQSGIRIREKGSEQERRGSAFYEQHLKLVNQPPHTFRPVNGASLMLQEVIGPIRTKTVFHPGEVSLAPANLRSHTAILHAVDFIEYAANGFEYAKSVFVK